MPCRDTSGSIRSAPATTRGLVKTPYFGSFVRPSCAGATAQLAIARQPKPVSMSFADLETLRELETLLELQSPRACSSVTARCDGRDCVRQSLDRSPPRSSFAIAGP